MAGKAVYLIILLLGVLVLAAMFMPQVRQLLLNLRAETVRVQVPDGSGMGTGQTTQDLRIITVLGKDGIPAILNPQFVEAAEAMPQMGPSERVMGVSINGDHRAYPLNLLSRHEIVNDTVGGVPVAVTWWPLCFTGIVYAREIADTTHTFGVSGKLIMNALVMYDHQTDTLWSQFLSRGVKGPLSETQLEIVPSVQTTWEQWLQLHPDTLVLDRRGGYQFDSYEGYYAGGSAGILGESNKDDRLPGKELVLGAVHNGTAKAYPFGTIADQRAINDSFGGDDVVVTFDGSSETGAIFTRSVDGRTLTFQDAGANDLGVMLIKDRETGSTWQAFTGQAIEGTMVGKVLDRLPSHYSFWFAWSDFHPDTEVFESS